MIASNIDIVFIVVGLDQRYLMLVYNSGAKPIIILNKIDLCHNIDTRLQEVNKVAYGVPVHIISVTKLINLEVFNEYLQPGHTVVFLGSSGVGKSSITNFLMNKGIQKTQETSSITGKGKHTTTYVEMLFHSSGGIIIDTPGLRELQLWCDEDALEVSFDDIIHLTNQCKFRNCTHHTEPGCAINEAIEQGELDPNRYERFIKINHELGYLNHRQKQVAKLKSNKNKEVNGGIR